MNTSTAQEGKIMRIGVVAIVAAAVLSLTACGALEGDSKVDVEVRGFTNVEVHDQTGFNKRSRATVSIGMCRQAELTADLSGHYQWYSPTGHDFKEDGGVTAAHLLDQDDFKQCNPPAKPGWTADNYKQELEKRGFANVVVSDQGSATSATATVGGCPVALPWIGIKGFPREWTYNHQKGRAGAPEGGLTAAYMKTLPEFANC
jgi:hypothetical protein